MKPFKLEHLDFIEHKGGKMSDTVELAYQINRGTGEIKVDINEVIRAIDDLKNRLDLNNDQRHALNTTAAFFEVIRDKALAKKQNKTGFFSFLSKVF